MPSHPRTATTSNAPIRVRSITHCESPVGPLICGATDDAVCMLQFCDDGKVEARRDALRRRYGDSLSPDPHPLLEDLKRQLAEYFSGVRRTFDAPLAFSGTPFQEAVWSTLRRIPYGATWSYLDVAREIGDPSATRAVGAANGENPIAIVIPCHRVVNADGKLGGYGGGLWRKRILLDLELGQGRLSL